jgi:hypothetical protein
MDRTCFGDERRIRDSFVCAESAAVTAAAAPTIRILFDILPLDPVG